MTGVIIRTSETKNPRLSKFVLIDKDILTDCLLLNETHLYNRFLLLEDKTNKSDDKTSIQT